MYFIVADAFFRPLKGVPMLTRTPSVAYGRDRGESIEEHKVRTHYTAVQTADSLSLSNPVNLIDIRKERFSGECQGGDVAGGGSGGFWRVLRVRTHRVERQVEDP